MPKKYQEEVRGGGGIIITMAIIFVLALLAGVYALASYRTVSPGNVGVVTHWGKTVESVLDPGLHFVVPLGVSVHEVNTSVQKMEIVAAASSVDLQQVSTKIALNYQLKPDKAVYIYSELGNKVEERIIDPSVHEAIKAVTAKYTAEELISKREQVRNDIISDLKDRLERHGVEIREFSIMDFAFSEQFNQAIEQKTVSMQNKEKAINDLERIKIEAEQNIVKGKAEAANLESQKAAISPDLIKLRELEVEKLAVDKWNGAMPQYITGGGQLPFMKLVQ